VNLVKNGFFLTSWSIASDSLITPCHQMGRSNMYIFRFVCTVRFLAVDSLIILGVPKSTFIMIQTLLLGFTFYHVVYFKATFFFGWVHVVL